MSNKTSDKNVANIEDEIMSQEAFNELIDNFEVVATLTMYGRKSIKHYVKEMQAELERKDKRIQELEEENKKKSIELICYQEELDNSIPEQAIKDKIEKLKNDYDQKYDLYMGYKVESREQQDILKQMSILQELLEGRNENE